MSQQVVSLAQSGYVPKSERSIFSPPDQSGGSGELPQLPGQRQDYGKPWPLLGGQWDEVG